MKKRKGLWFLLVLSVLCACHDDGEGYEREETFTYQVYEPVARPLSEVREAVKVNGPGKITQAGKICLYKDYLYIIDPYKGIHILDNRRPEAPRLAGFIELPGTNELAIRNDRLYADSYIDLVWFHLADPEHPVFEGRIEKAFEQVLPPVEKAYAYDDLQCDSIAQEGRSVVVGWKLASRTVTICHRPPEENGLDSNVNAGEGSRGLNGSMSRFGLYQSYLYVAGDHDLSVFDLAAGEPVKSDTGTLPIYGVESVFNYKDYLFLGTRGGMQIFSLRNPLAPEFCKMVPHILGRDPVVVENDLAYVTVHAENPGFRPDNILQVVDISDVKWPVEVARYEMTQPKGLGIDHGTLFVCDDGLKVFRTDPPQQLMENCLLHAPDIKGYDVIPNGHLLILIAEDGLYQYDYSDLNRISFVSKFPIGEE